MTLQAVKQIGLVLAYPTQVAPKNKPLSRIIITSY